jgi:FkbM family methyltransferase
MHRVGRDGLWFVHINRQFRWPILKELEAITKIDPMMFSNEPPIEPPKATTPKHVGRNQSEAKEGSEIRGAFELERCDLQNHSSIVSSDPLTVEGPSQKWSYAASFSNLLPASSAQLSAAAELNVEVTLLGGKLAIGLVYPDNNTFITQKEVSEVGSKQRVSLIVPKVADVRALILRNADVEETVKFAVHAITLHEIAPVQVASARGFGPKSIVGDVLRLSEGKIHNIFDVGANVGDMTDAFLAAFPDARIYAFEPHPEVARRTSDRFASTDRVSVLNEALGTAPSTLALHCYSNSAINSLNSVSDAGSSLMDGEVRSLGTIITKVDTVDRLMAEEGIQNLDLLKLDTQGSELAVLKGANVALQRGNIKFIIAELLFVPLYDNQSSFSEVCQYLLSMGYDLVDFYDFVYTPEGQLKWGDGLFRLRS